MTVTTEVWTRWEFEDRESARIAVDTLREELVTVTGVAEVDVEVEPPSMGAMEIVAVVTAVLALPTVLDNAVTSTAHLVETIRRLKSRLTGLRSAAIEGEDGELHEVDGG
ncbi:hypothetical protein GCM10009665_49770 [Kitasatospora nipponensis]|uniref:Uncharacterized protein n=1 Tax=Kitasatospora nipponensis TaxID=258049 RepID=A0ABN1WRJ7_9ACTN